MDYLGVLKKYFGYSSFRGIQQDIVESIGSGHDTLGLMPTGGGKSITFQVPALAKPGVCIVITPLIALMNDQVKHLRDNGILASSIHSGMTYNEINQVLDNAIYGGVKFLYVSPERLSSSVFIDKLRYMNVCFVAVDEAHCISQWGYDFRPSYLKIAEIRDILPGVPVLALTATATPEVIDDIMDKLNFLEKRVFRMSFYRENLVYVVRGTDNKHEELCHVLRSVPGSSIVYSRSRRGVTELAEFLNENGITATFYHAGLGAVEKENRQQDWAENRIRVMVATNAFGMGIDKPDVRLVVHMESPDSIEAYFQEAGRGGRDGKKSYAVLLYNVTDRQRLSKRLKLSFPDKEYIRKAYDDLAYYFQLAVNDGLGARYEFEIEHFCSVFHHYPDRLLGAMNILQRSGYIQFDIDAEIKTRCKILVRRDDLYNIKGLSRIDDDVLTTLMRKYTGVFTEYVFIDEESIAAWLQVGKRAVREALKSMSHRNILHFIPGKNTPMVTYMHDRVESDKLIIPVEAYETLFQRSENRIEAILRYAENDEACRSSQLLGYFGEKASKSCGRCDVCVSSRHSSVSIEATPYYNIFIGEFMKADNILPISQLIKIPIPRAKLDEIVADLRSKDKLIVEGVNVRLVE